MHGSGAPVREGVIDHVGSQSGCQSNAPTPAAFTDQAHVGRGFEVVTQRLDSVRDKLNETIEASRALAGTLTTTNQTLTNELANTQQAAGDKIEELRGNLNTQLDEIRRTQRVVEDQFKQADQAIKTESDDIRRKMDEVIKGLTDKIFVLEATLKTMISERESDNGKIQAMEAWKGAAQKGIQDNHESINRNWAHIQGLASAGITPPPGISNQGNKPILESKAVGNLKTLASDRGDYQEWIEHI